MSSDAQIALGAAQSAAASASAAATAAQAAADAISGGVIGGGSSSSALIISAGGAIDLNNSVPNGTLVGYRFTGTATVEGATVAAGSYMFTRETDTSLAPLGWLIKPLDEGTALSAGPVDSTAPGAGTLASSAITSSGATVTVSSASDETALHASPYSFSKDNGTTWTAYQSSNVYNWTGLTSSTSYQMRHRVRDAGGNVTVGMAITVATPSPPSAITETFNLADDTNMIGRTTTTGGKTWVSDNDASALGADGAIAPARLNRLTPNGGSPSTIAIRMDVGQPEASIKANYDISGNPVALFVAGANGGSTLSVHMNGGTGQLYDGSGFVASGAIPSTGEAQLSYKAGVVTFKVNGSTIFTYSGASGRTSTYVGIAARGVAWIDNVGVDLL